MNDGAIRNATEADLPVLVELMRQLQYPNDATHVTDAHRTALALIQATPGQRLLVIEDAQGQVAGTAQLMILPNLSRDALPRAVIENVCVDERLRGQRFGERLVAYCIARAREAGCFKVALTSNRRREAAHRFWERQGFEHTHRGYALALIDISSTPETDSEPAAP